MGYIGVIVWLFFGIPIAAAVIIFNCPILLVPIALACIGAYALKRRHDAREKQRWLELWFPDGKYLL